MTVINELQGDTNDYTWGVRYWSLNAVGADPGDEYSWSEAVFITESALDAYTLFDQYVAAYAANPDVRNIQLVYTPKIQWRVQQEESPGDAEAARQRIAEALRDTPNE